MIDKLLYVKRRVFRNGWRKQFTLMALGLIALVIGLGSIAQPIPEQARNNASVLLSIAPIELWYVLFTIVGLLALASAIVARLRPAATGAYCGLFCFVGLCFLWAWVLNPLAGRAWISGLLYGMLGLWMLVEAGRDGR